MQSGYRAKGNLGYYGEGLFDFGPFEAIQAEVLVLGRACVHQKYRNTAVLHMLWRGITRYASSCGARYLIGCSSLSRTRRRVPRGTYSANAAQSRSSSRSNSRPRRGAAATEAISRVSRDSREALRTAGDRPGIQDD